MGDTTEEMSADEDHFAALRLYPVGCHREGTFGLRAGAPPLFFLHLGLREGDRFVFEQRANECRGLLLCRAFLRELT